MMKKRLQGLIAGILIGAALVGGATVIADQTIRIMIDGRELIPLDPNGKRVDPIIIDGTTYLPVRAVSEALGKAVYWDGPNTTVYLGDMDGVLGYPSIELKDMTSINKEMRLTDRLTDNYDNKYQWAIYNDYWNGYNFEYLLNMKYSWFKGTLYIPNGETSDKSVYLSIIADGNTIYKSPDMTKVSRPEPIKVDVRGYNDIKIEFSEPDNTSLSACLTGGFYQ